MNLYIHLKKDTPYKLSGTTVESTPIGKLMEGQREETVWTIDGEITKSAEWPNGFHVWISGKGLSPEEIKTAEMVKSFQGLSAQEIIEKYKKNSRQEVK